MELILPWPPSLNTYWRTFNGRMILSEKGRLYRQHVMEQCLLQRVDTFTGPITVEIVAYRPDNRKRDLDNLLKAVLDGMAKGACVRGRLSDQGPENPLGGNDRRDA